MSNTNQVALRFTGSPIVRRVIGDYEWTAENGHVCEVDIELAADLLSGRESDTWELAGKPKAATLKLLAETMGLVPADLIVVPTDDMTDTNEVKENG